MRPSKGQDGIELGELLHLQYLALLIKDLHTHFAENKNISSRLSVFIVPASAEKYPFRSETGWIDYGTYELVSQYLRLLSKEYTGIVYSVAPDRTLLLEPEVTALDFKKGRRFETYFPLLLVDADQYIKLFDVSVDCETIAELLKLKKNKRFRLAGNTNPKTAFIDFILETSYRRIQESLKDKGILWVQECMDYFACQNENSVISFAFYAFMLVANEGDNLEQFRLSLRKVWGISGEICRGIKQVVQNAIQHSQIHECFFSFYLHQSADDVTKEEFARSMSLMYPDTSNFVLGEDGRYNALEVFVSDINEYEDMLDNFARNLRSEIKEDNTLLEGHESLMRSIDRVAIRNFFSEFQEGDPIDEWVDFREQDIAAHVGLGLFALTAHRCAASVKVLSCKNGRLMDERNYFYKAYGNSELRKKKYQNDLYVIPGTQFSVLLPIGNWEEEQEKGLGQLYYADSILEDYSSFAEYLDYEQERELITINPKATTAVNSYTKAKEKYKLVLRWQKYWSNKIEEMLDRCIKDTQGESAVMKVINFDFQQVQSDKYFKNSDYIEVYVKGLIGAVSGLGRNMVSYYIALTNLPTGIIDAVCRIFVVLCARKFPDNLQMFLHESEGNRTMALVGDNLFQVQRNAYVLSLEHGSDCISRIYSDISEDLVNILLPYGRKDGNTQKSKRMVFPFDVVLSRETGEGEPTLFEERISAIAEKPLDGQGMGYKLADTHMRLGSKVHIESFYEMSFLFYRTTIANRIAFLILRNLRKNKEGTDNAVDLNKDTLLFYGYASYSKAILTSITEILRKYRSKTREKDNGKAENNVAFASFQHNLQLESEDVQMHFGLPDGFAGRVDGDNILTLDGVTKIIQIVPISSTLTTFDKMWSRLRKSISSDSLELTSIQGNYTVFWVVDRRGNLEKGIPSEIEEKYWTKVSPAHLIQTGFEIMPNGGKTLQIYYFVRSAVAWHDPIHCSLCYPTELINEVPLVETDPTSTVPAQQIRSKHMTVLFSDEEILENKEKIEENNSRIKSLSGCVAYDHISRGQNHYQFFIDTQKYFYCVKNEVKKWLGECREQTRPLNHIPVLNIIFSPEHNTNVGFAQYVNIYYFGGMAELISLNVDKEYRSNFKCEHAALINIIDQLYKSSNGSTERLVRFYFVDDTIITGDSINKAKRLLLSLLPLEVQARYSVSIFERVFVLMERLSAETKRMYVNNADENFLSFVHIDISNMRTKGDSCVGCKLEQISRKMFKRSATRSSAEYWVGKLDNYHFKPYDDRKRMSQYYNQKSFERLLISHTLQNTIVNEATGNVEGGVFSTLLDIMQWLMADDEKRGKLEKGFSPIFVARISLLRSMEGISGLQHLLKIVCRPFFVFDYKIKAQVLTLLIFMSEYFLGNSGLILENKEAIKKQYIFEDGLYEKTMYLLSSVDRELGDTVRKLVFLREYLIEGLADMGSTYLMRKKTILAAYQYVKARRNRIPNDVEKVFWKEYAVNLYRIVTGNADETKELRMERLCLSGNEYVNDEEIGPWPKRRPSFLFETITGDKAVSKDDVYFYQFCHEIFFANTGIRFDKLELSDNLGIETTPEWNNPWKQLQRLQEEILGKAMGEGIFEAERKIFEMLKLPKSRANTSADDWYTKLFGAIADLLREKYFLDSSYVQISLLVESQEDTSDSIDIFQRLDIARPQHRSMYYQAVSEKRYQIKEDVVESLSGDGEAAFDLKRSGYYIADKNPSRQQPYLVILFDNHDTVSGINSDKGSEGIEKVYLYMRFDKTVYVDGTEISRDIMFYIMRFIMRDILTYRNRILRCLKRDFESDIFARYVHMADEKSILIHEKATSHNTTADDRISAEIFVNPQASSAYDVLYEKGKERGDGQVARWLLLRNYTNGQIAKIFNRSFVNNKWDIREDAGSAPPMYIEVGKYADSELFTSRLEKFADLGMADLQGSEQQDERFALLRSIMDIECNGLVDAEFYHNSKGQYYNLEYFKCILIDICISAIKFQSDRPDYLLRVDNYLNVRRRIPELKTRLKKYEKEAKEKGRRNIEKYICELKSSCCNIQMFRRCGDDRNFDYLVIRNPVDKLAHNLNDWAMQNTIIERRLRDPLDYADGHMSLLAIKRYIEKLNPSLRNTCRFYYTEEVSVAEEDGRLYFETWLPVLKKEGEKDE